MTRAFEEKGRRIIAWTLLAMLYFETVIPAYALGVRNAPPPATFTRKAPKVPAAVPVADASPRVAEKPEKAPPAPAPKPFNGGPTQPESQAFQSVNSANMVDLFTGDFSYNIPLIDVGGYPLGLGYSSGIGMDQEASWCGLGWNINPGSIIRNMRGIPDDFNGEEVIKKTLAMKENITYGGSIGAEMEIAGFPLSKVLEGKSATDSLSVNLGVSIGLFHNNYRGWGMEHNVTNSIAVGSQSFGQFTTALSLTNNSQEGFTQGMSFGYRSKEVTSMGIGTFTGNGSVSLAYNSRGGMQALQSSGGLNISRARGKIRPGASGSLYNSSIAFASPSFTPTITVPWTSTNTSFRGKLGGLIKLWDTEIKASGYKSEQTIEPEDQTQRLEAYGYLHFDRAKGNPRALLDFNREKDMPFRDDSNVPNIAIPTYTYDIFTMSGEGTGGSFRAYRNDVGYVHDHYMETRNKSRSYNGDVALGDIVKVGVDVSLSRSRTEAAPWTEQNPLAQKAQFTKSGKLYEATYFRNPGEKTIINGSFHDAMGGDDVVYPTLFDPGGNSSNMSTTGQLSRFRGGRTLESFPLNLPDANTRPRDKRSQVISYLNAEEASEVGFPKFIENYGVNQYVESNCNDRFPVDTEQDGGALKWDLFADIHFNRVFWKGRDVSALNWGDKDAFYRVQGWDDVWENGKEVFNMEMHGAQWTQRFYGRVKAPYTGKYKFKISSRDAHKLIINDSTVSNRWSWGTGPGQAWDSDATFEHHLNLEAGKVYKFEAQQGNFDGFNTKFVVESELSDPKNWYYPPTVDTFVAVPGKLFKEKRENEFRRKNHISQVDVLNNDGRRYVYGLPVYNLFQKEVSFAVKKENGSRTNGTVTYAAEDTTVNNPNGQDNYYSAETIPAYAHSFLLTGILSSDYVDVTGNGISDDDPGNAIKFNYTKTAGVRNPYKWRTPHGQVAGYDEGLRSNFSDDKGNYVYGEKELWYLHSIESKNMVATFTLEDREDMFSVLENGSIETGNNSAKRLKEINLYSKAELLKRGSNARPVKTVHFEYSYDLCKDATTYPGRNTGKLTLKKVWFSYNGNKKGQKNAYVFNYGNNPAYNSQSSDRWGNFKKPLDNPRSTAENLVTNAEFPYSLQDSLKAAQNAGAWALDSIQLPSGGRIKVSYESDDYAFVQNRRAGIMCNVAGFSKSVPQSFQDLESHLYAKQKLIRDEDFQFISINVPVPVHSLKELEEQYLQGMRELYFRLCIRMPEDRWGNGTEFVSGYADLQPGQYGYFNNGNTIWLKVKSINKKGDWGGLYSPFAKSATDFVRLNLPTKAYPDSDMGASLDAMAAVKFVAGMAPALLNSFRSFDDLAHANQLGRTADLNRSYVRLLAPGYRKFGGGHRVKRVVVYDNWNAMTKQKESMYGTEYQYTTTHRVGGKDVQISSGVATYEPMLGGEENTYHSPAKYTDRSSWLAPTTLGFVDFPLGETLFPYPSVGYRKVTTKSIKTEKIRSANGFEESCFYTAYEFPVFVENSLLNDDAKQVHHPLLNKLLKIDVTHYVNVTQGFKVELNDMHGKPRSSSSWSVLDTAKLVSSTTYHYRVENPNAEHKKLRNDVLAMNAQGEINGTTIIGKDMELMLDLRQHRSTTHALDANANVNIFTATPIGVSGSGFVFPYKEAVMFRSAAATKVIYRHGLLDSITVTDKGSSVTTHNMLYDGETGDVILSSVQNEFDDLVYSFNYPAGWMYDGMAGAYKNIGATFTNVYFKDGKIVSGIDPLNLNEYFSSGDEILVYSRNAIPSSDPCKPELATFPSMGKIWAVDANGGNGETPEIFFQDADGKPFTAYEVRMKIIRSGRRNIAASAGSVSMLVNPLVKTGNVYGLKIDENSRITNAQMIEYKQSWQVEDRKKQKVVCFF
ncbi:PA14 domain-containing protein [Chitinophaga caseinilytica]|uniref:PA14 domain-containing protein n=1 Tax=Chitinophaga caseinilytica TaxID=2267521 RepID=UPI003C2C6CE3